MSENASDGEVAARRRAEDDPEVADTFRDEDWDEPGHRDRAYEDSEYEFDSHAVTDYAEGDDPEADPAVRDRSRPAGHPDADAEQPRRYRPGRGGFDPEAAEIAARAKYAHRQRVVVGLLLAAVVTAIAAAVVLPVVWWAHGLVDLALVGYLVYLRKQVRIENEVRERRMARLSRDGGGSYARDSGGVGAESFEQPQSELDDEPPDSDDPARAGLAQDRPRYVPRRPRRPVAEPIQHNGVYVDIEDEDPAFYELDEPGEQPFRRAAGQ